MAFRPERRRLAKDPAETGVDALRPFNGGAEPPRLHAVQAGTPERRVSRISSGGGQFRPLSGTTRIETSPMKRALRPGLLGVVLAAVFAVAPASAANLSSVSVAPTSVVGGGASTGTVTLDAVAPTGGAAAPPLASNNAAAMVPAGVTVAGGAKTATFAITTTSVTANAAATITASYSAVNKTATLTVTTLLASVTLGRTSVVGGISVTGTATLYAPAPAGGTVVTLAS